MSVPGKRIYLETQEQPTPALYYLFNVDLIVYIGQSFNAEKRVREHMEQSKKRFDIDNRIAGRPFGLYVCFDLSDFEDLLLTELPPRRTR